MERGWKRTHFSTDINPELHGKDVTVLGWVQEIRDLGGIKFLVLRDDRGTVQITIPRNEATREIIKEVDGLSKESVIGVKGKVRAVEKAPRGVEVIPYELSIFSKAKPSLPIDPTGRTKTGLSKRLDFRILDLRRPEVRSIFKIRHFVTNAIRRFLIERGFIEVHTPKIISSATEGGSALFPVMYFEQEAFLAQSPQLYKEQLISVFESVFEIGPIFRAEEFHTTRHLCESISVDIEKAFSTAEDIMEILEELVIYSIESVKRECSEELKLLDYNLEVPKRPFERYTYDDVLKELKERFNITIEWGEDFSTPILRLMGSIHKGFYFITHWPTKTKPFYILPFPHKPEICDAFDLMYGWIEIASGGTRIHSKDLLIERIKEQGLSPNSFEFHIRTFDYGMPPHAGAALGLERFMLVLTGCKNIREVSLFPRDKTRLTP